MPGDLAPDLAAKVLGADLRNLIQKVSDGGTLTAGERELMRQFTLPPVDVARQARDAALYMRWASGGRLSPEELQEIEALLARQSAPERAPVAPTTALPSPDPDPAVPFSLSPPPTSKRPRLSREQLDRWKETYGTEPRQIRRYIALGAEKDDPCPLDEPIKMPSWWERNMKHSVPQKILEAAKAALAQAPPVEGRDGGLSPEKTVAAESVAESEPASFDFPAQVARLRLEQSRIQRQLDIARAGVKTEAGVIVNQADCESLLRQSLDLTTELRKAENDLTKWLEARDLLVLKSDVRGENARIAGAIYAAVLRLITTVRPLLPGKTDAEQDKLWKQKTAACFESLKEARFTDCPAVLVQEAA